MLSSVILVTAVGILGPAFGLFVNQPQWSKPWFCHENDCPKYTVQETIGTVEMRRYEPSVWVSTQLAAMQYTNTERQAMFWKLFQYIAGNNTAHTKIPMTSPVVTEVEHGAGPDCESNFTMNFMIPFDLQADPPAPTENGVIIQRKPEMNVYVKSYGGFSNDTTNRDNLLSLVDILDKDNRVYKDNIFFTAGYDGPYRFTNRHNEVWVQAV